MSYQENKKTFWHIDNNFYVKKFIKKALEIDPPLENKNREEF